MVLHVEKHVTPPPIEGHQRDGLVSRPGMFYLLSATKYFFGILFLMQSILEGEIYRLCRSRELSGRSRCLCGRGAAGAQLRRRREPRRAGELRKPTPAPVSAASQRHR